MLLVLTSKLDGHADQLIRQVGGSFPILRLNSDDFARDYEVSLEISDDGAMGGFIRDRHGHSYDFAQPAIGWYRKPNFERMHVEADPDYAGVVREEAASVVEALFALPTIHWVNNPATVTACYTKPAQMLKASKLGFAVPRTVITNLPDDAERFAADAPGGLIVKSINSAMIPFEQGDFSSMTRRIDAATLSASRDSIASCPTQLQDEIAKDFELRVTVVGDEVFAARIDSQHDTRTEVDWRADPDACRYATFDLPDWVEDGCRTMVREAGLDFGAIDLIVSTQGDYVFLENNPAGQYIWLENATGMPITAALIRLFERRMREMAGG